MEQLRSVFSAMDMVRQIDEENGKFLLYLSEDISAAEINRIAFDKGITLTHLFRKSRSLESEFLQITAELD